MLIKISQPQNLRDVKFTGINCLRSLTFEYTSLSEATKDDGRRFVKLAGARSLERDRNDD